MPQVWVSYDELGLHYRCSPSIARERVSMCGWPRRKCSDGLTRVKLPEAVMADYIRKRWPSAEDGAGTMLNWTQPALEPSIRSFG